MKTKTVELHVPEKFVRVLADPTNRGHKTTYAYVKIKDLPDLPTEINPRAQNTKSRVARQIAEGLIDSTEVFHLLNRGITMVVLSSKYNNSTETLSLEIAGSYGGVLDGGHSMRVIQESTAPYRTLPEEEQPDFFDGFVKLEIIEGVKGDLIVELAKSRNTSAQVQNYSLANLEGDFDWLKEELQKTSFGPLIAYKENEDDSKPIDVREVVSLLTAFHPSFEDSENPPVISYSSKGRCLELLRSDPKGFQSLHHIVPDVLRLYDHIHLKFAELYEQIGGFSGLDEKNNAKSIKLGKVREVRKFEEGFPLYYSGGTAYFQFPGGWLMPVLGSLRGLVSYKTVAKWETNPFEFFDKHGKKLVMATLEASRSLGRNPNAVGKSKNHWAFLHEKVLNTFNRQK